MLDAMQFNSTPRYGDDLSEVKALLDLVKPSGDKYWLYAPDATTEHSAACGKKRPGTGMWLIRSSQFSDWLTKGNSVVVLNSRTGWQRGILLYG